MSGSVGSVKHPSPALAHPAIHKAQMKSGASILLDTGIIRPIRNIFLAP